MGKKVTEAKEPVAAQASENSVPAVAEPKAALAVKPAVDHSTVEQLQEARESLDSFTDLKLPLIRFKEGFTFAEGEDPVEEFEGVILYTKETNVYYANRYKPGSAVPPDCFSPDGRVPSVANPQSPDCKSCKHNQFGSSREGEGKACKNTRPVYILTDGAVIPRVLRIPPTSIGLVKQYILKLATDYGSYMGVKTKFSAYKKTESQTHYNIQLSFAGKLNAQEKVNVAFIREGWLQLMKEQQFHAPDMDGDAAAGPAEPAAAQSVETSF